MLADVVSQLDKHSPLTAVKPVVLTDCHVRPKPLAVPRFDNVAPAGIVIVSPRCAYGNGITAFSLIILLPL
jgi:hypothetical protein